MFSAWRRARSCSGPTRSDASSPRWALTSPHFPSTTPSRRHDRLPHRPRDEARGGRSADVRLVRDRRREGRLERHGIRTVRGAAIPARDRRGARGARHHMARCRASAHRPHPPGADHRSPVATHALGTKTLRWNAIAAPDELASISHRQGLKLTPVRRFRRRPLRVGANPAGSVAWLWRRRGTSVGRAGAGGGRASCCWGWWRASSGVRYSARSRARAARRPRTTA